MICYLGKEQHIKSCQECWAKLGCDVYKSETGIKKES